jgi:CRP-like cAMP-binding protein
LAPTGETLRGIQAFASLTSVAIASLDQAARWRRYRAGQEILGQMEQSTDVFFVVEGRVRAAAYSASGKQVTYRDIEAGDMFGEFAAIDGEPRSATVVALADTLIASLSAEKFRTVLRSEPDVAGIVLKRLTNQIRALTERVFEFSALAVENRIQAEVLRLARDHMESDNSALITPAPTHADIASRVSTHREAVTRALSDLAHRGIVERRGGDLAVLDIEALSELVEHAINA